MTPASIERTDSLPEAVGKEDWWSLLQRLRDRREASGHRFMNDEELQAHIDWLRQGDAIDELLRQHDPKQQAR